MSTLIVILFIVIFLYVLYYLQKNTPYLSIMIYNYDKVYDRIIDDLFLIGYESIIYDGNFHVILKLNDGSEHKVWISNKWFGYMTNDYIESNKHGKLNFYGARPSRKNMLKMYKTIKDLEIKKRKDGIK